MLLAIATLAFRLTNADVAISRIFFDPSDGEWPLAKWWLFAFFFDWGVLPAWLIGVAGLVVGIVGLFWDRLRPWAPQGFFLAFLLILGPGLLVNVCLKDNWGRPRPRQTVAFGGPNEFLAVWQPSALDGHSFPCGHASMGFYLMAPAFLLARRRPWLMTQFLLLGIVAGVAIGIGRMAQGQHFASDVLWAGGFVYLTGLLLCAVMRIGPFEAIGAAATAGAQPVLLSIETARQRDAATASDREPQREAA